MATIVILPGWEQTNNEWQAAQDAFGEIHTVILEFPGFGDTPLINDSWGIPEYATYIENEIAKLELSDVILLGHSFGGRVASLIASKKPTWLTALILYGAPSIYRPTKKTKAISAIAKFAKSLGFSKKLTPNNELKAADAKGLGTIFRKAISFDQTTFLPAISVPTLLLWGSEDSEVPTSIAKEMHLLINNSILDIIEHAGHNLHLTHHNIFYGKIKKFIETV